MAPTLYKLQNGLYLRDPATGLFPTTAAGKCCPCLCTPACISADMYTEEPWMFSSLVFLMKPGYQSDYGSDPTAVKCTWSPVCRDYDGYSINLFETYDGRFYMHFQEAWGPLYVSDEQSSIYSVFSFSGYPTELHISITAASDSRCSDGYACVSYKKVGSSWDVVRLCVPACSLPEDWWLGWLEDNDTSEDFFECRVIGDVPINCSTCVWDASSLPWYGQNLCASRGGGPEFILYWCLPFPNHSSAPCILYGNVAKWARGSGDDDTLFLDWDGVCTYDFFGGGGTVGTNPSGPFGTYTSGGETVTVYPCA